MKNVLYSDPKTQHLGKKVANKPRLRAYMLVNGETSKALNTVKEECFKISREMKTES